MNRWILVQFVGGLVLVGCSGRSQSDADPSLSEPIAECDSYVATMRRCMGSLGPHAAEASKGQLAALGGAFQAHGPDERAAMRARCVEATRKISGACQ